MGIHGFYKLVNNNATLSCSLNVLNIFDYFASWSVSWVLSLKMVIYLG